MSVCVCVRVCAMVRAYRAVGTEGGYGEGSSGETVEIGRWRDAATVILDDNECGAVSPSPHTPCFTRMVHRCHLSPVSQLFFLPCSPQSACNLLRETRDVTNGCLRGLGALWSTEPFDLSIGGFTPLSKSSPCGSPLVGCGQPPPLAAVVCEPLGPPHPSHC